MVRQGVDQASVGTALAVASVSSLQFGAALAVTLFPAAGPLGTVSLRLIGGAAVLVAVTRLWRVNWNATDIGNACLFGVVIMVMNTAFYFAIKRLPLATAATIEFLGPLAVAVATATSWRSRAWALPAATGVALIGGTLHLRDLVGVACALTAALGWSGYIVMSRKVGVAKEGLAGLCVATVLGAVIMAPIGAVAAGTALLEPHILAVGLTVGVLCSALPYSFDLLALRRLPTAVFGVLTSLNPAVAAIAGYLVLGNHLPAPELAGIALVVVASAGTTLSGGRTSDLRPSAGRKEPDGGSGHEAHGQPPQIERENPQRFPSRPAIFTDPDPASTGTAKRPLPIKPPANRRVEYHPARRVRARAYWAALSTTKIPCA
jgi:inner membrane transporter RhtA